MKIALFTDSDVFAGTERHLYDLACALREQGVAVQIIAPAQGVLAQRAREARVPVLAVEKESGLDWPAVQTLKRQLQSGAIDLIHSHNGRTCFISTLAVLLAGRGHTVTTQHFLAPARTDRRGWRGWIGRKLHQWMIARASKVIAISDAVRDAILQRGEAPTSKVERVWNGIADPALTPLRPAAEVRTELQTPLEAPVIVCAARLEEEKLVRVLIEAMALLSPAAASAGCWIAGEGRQKAELEALIQARGVGDRVRLLGFRTDVLSLVQAADLFVLPSAAEPFGLSIVEAMALRKPVIATRAGGPLEIVVDGETGLLVPPGEPDALARALEGLLNNRALAADYGESGRHRFETQFAAPRMAQEMASVYRSALGLTPSVETATVPV